MNGSLLRMRPLEPGGVTLFESPLTSLQTTWSRRILELFTRALLLETLLSRHVQLRFRRQRCTARRFLSGGLTDFISSPFFRRGAVSCAGTVEERQATRDEGGQPHQHKGTHGFELCGNKARSG